MNSLAVNFVSKVFEFQLWFLYIYDASLVVISIIKVICTFVLPVMTRNMAKIDEKFNDFSIATITELRDQIKQEVSEEFKKREELESTVCML